MLKYFRKNRRKFIANDGSTGRTQSNRVSKYLLYAIGEIALVMIGILLALQVNNWNEKKKSNQRQTIYLTQIQQEMNSNLVSLKSNQDKLERMIAELQSFVALSDKNLEEITEISLSGQWAKVFSRSVVTRNENGVLLSIISTGGLKEITNDSIRNALASRGTKVDRVRTQEEVFNEYLDKGNRYLEEKGSFRQILDDNDLHKAWGIGRLPIAQSNKFLLESSNFENILAFAIATGNTLFDAIYKTYEEQLINLLEIIKTELD